MTPNRAHARILDRWLDDEIARRHVHRSRGSQWLLLAMVLVCTAYLVFTVVTHGAPP